MPTACGPSGPHVRNDDRQKDEEEVAEEDINGVGKDRQDRQEDENFFSPVAVRQETPYGGEQCPADVGYGKDHTDDDGRESQLVQIDSEDDVQVGESKGPYPARNHDKLRIPM